MLTRLRAFWHEINASYWFYPALFALLALALAFGTLWLDRHGWAEWLSELEAVQPARPESARNMLTVISGSMIGVASTVFSITIAAVAYASGNYGPRLLTNFMEDRGNQFSLATFIGTFVYSITVLRTVRAEYETPPDINGVATTAPGFVPQLSLLVAFLLMGVSVAVLVYFLNHIPASIRINTVLEGIGERLLKGIKRYFPDPDAAQREPVRPDGEPILATEVGYVQLVNYGDLADVAEKHGGRIVMAVRTGDFVHAGVPIAFWHADEQHDDDEAEDGREKLGKAVRDGFALGGMRTPHQDLQFLVDELVEIGMRALSPGINDPFTAVTALHWLGAATAELGRRDLRLRINREVEPEDAVVLPLEDDYTHFLHRGFGAIRGSVATSRIAAQVMFDALRDAARTLNDESRRTALKRQGDLLLAQAREHLTGPELDEVEARHAGFVRSFAS